MYSPGVDIGDGCVVGAGAVVTRSIPPYHVAAGVPARVLQKVAIDVPDAPGIVYETKGDRVVVHELARTHNRIDGEIEHSSHEKSFERVLPLQWLDAMKTRMTVWLGTPRHTVFGVCALIVAVGVTYWMGESMSE